MKVLDLKNLSGNHRIVWEAMYEYRQQHRNEYDRVSYTTEQTTTHIIAPSIELARAAFIHRYPLSCHFKLHYLVALLLVDLEVSISDGRSL